jgi:3-hydroxymyristoyl/3-hydroxydecanoyl-(acyl carrier protein) dehydratase
MEMALQPCGFLSAYMGTIKDKSHLDLYFRNLDGEGTLLFWPELPEIITNQVELISSSTLQDVIIQEYSFTLFSEDKPFYNGKSSFGYFTQPMLINQTGLDGNQTTTPWIASNPEAGSWKLLSSKKPAAFTPHLPTPSRIWISKSGGVYQNGYLYGTLDLSNDAWFYKAHFFQDPVMPGSLGVEAMARAIISASPEWGIPHNAQWRVKPNRTTTWKYRGQITPTTSQVGIELHIKEFAAEDRITSILADGTLWKENKRIYQIENIALETIWPT